MLGPDLVAIKHKLLWVQIPLNLSILFAFMYFTWKGTKHQVFFSKINNYIMMILGSIFLIWNIVELYRLLSSQEGQDIVIRSVESIAVIILNLTSIVYQLISWLYYGVMKL